jgi:hypothetical protein
MKLQAQVVPAFFFTVVFIVAAFVFAERQVVVSAGAFVLALLGIIATVESLMKSFRYKPGQRNYWRGIR